MRGASSDNKQQRVIQLVTRIDNDKQRVVQLLATGDTTNENNELKRVITSGTTNYN